MDTKELKKELKLKKIKPNVAISKETGSKGRILGIFKSGNVLVEVVSAKGHHRAGDILIWPKDYIT